MFAYLVSSLNKFGKPYSFKTRRASDYKCIRIAFQRLIAQLQTHDPELADYLKENLVLKGKFLWRE